MALPISEKERMAAEFNSFASRLSWSVTDSPDVDRILWVEFVSVQTAKCVELEPNGWIRIGKLKVSPEGVVRAMLVKGMVQLAVYYRRLIATTSPEVFFVESLSVRPIAVYRLGLQQIEGALTANSDRARFFVPCEEPTDVKRFGLALANLLRSIELARLAFIYRDLS